MWYYLQKNVRKRQTTYFADVGGVLIYIRLLQMVHVGLSLDKSLKYKKT